MRSRRKRTGAFARILERGGFTKRNEDNAWWNSVLPWLQLVRLPNLFTVVGDPLAGACIASAVAGIAVSFWNALDVCLCSLLLYIFGLIQNDLCDYVEDARIRPERPLPSRRISKGAAKTVAGACAIVALILSFLSGQSTFLLSLLLLALISAYNIYLKRFPAQGALGMGLCRGVNVLLGASMVGISFSLVLPVAGTVVFIAFVTMLADGENRRQIPDRKVFFPALTLVVSWGLSLPFIPLGSFTGGVLPSLVFMLLAGCGALFAGAQVYERSVRPQEMQTFIGRLIGILIPWQAAWIALCWNGHFLLLLVLSCLAWLIFTFAGRFARQS